MLTRRKGPNEFLEVLRQNIKDLEDIDLELKRELLSKISEINPLYEKLNIDSSILSKGYVPQLFSWVTSGISGESKKEIHRQIAVGELFLRKMNAFCGTPGQYCHTFWKRFGPICGQKLYENLKDCPCHICEEYEGNIIGINRGLFMLFHNVIELLLAFPTIVIAYTTGEEVEAFEPLLSEEDIASSIYQVVKLEIKGEIPNFPPRAIFKDERINLLAFLSGYAYLFVITHELSHFLLERICGRPLMPLELENEKMEFSLWTERKEKEFECDETGFAILLNHVYSMIDDFEIMKAIAGVEILFLVFELCERIGKYPPSLTHPSAKARTERLRQKYKFPDRYYVISDAFISLWENTILKEILEKYNV